MLSHMAELGQVHYPPFDKGGNSSRLDNANLFDGTLCRDARAQDSRAARVCLCEMVEVVSASTPLGV